MSIQPIERNTVNFQLYFEAEDKYYEIDKPIDLEKADFEIKQNNNGFGRYLTFADSLNIGFSPRLNHEFKRLCAIYKYFKWQTGIYLIIRIDDNEFYRGRFKLETAETDFTYSFKCQVDVNNLREVIESKKSETIDLKSNKSLDEKDISSIELTPVLTRLKEIFISNVAYLDNTKAHAHYMPSLLRMELNLFDKKGVGNDSLVQGSSRFKYPLDLSDTTRFINGNAVSQLTVDIKDIEINFDFDKSVKVSFFRTIHNADGSVNNEVVLSYNAGLKPKLKHTSKEYVNLAPGQILRYWIRFENLSPGDSPKGWVVFNKKCSINIMSVDKFGNTITQCSRLINVGGQILKSITNNQAVLNAPKFTEESGQFYDIYATSGLFLRQYDNEPFATTWKAFADYLRASFNCDFQINNNNVFIGHETEFYKNIEVGRFPFEPNKDTFKVATNQRLAKSSFTIGYNKYEDDKDSSNTIDSIHVKSEFYLPNSQPISDSKVEFNINYIADQYKIENIRRESFDKDPTKTVPSDKDIYIIDTYTADGVLQNRSNKGINADNIYSPQTTYNLRLSTKRLIIDYFSEYLANISQFSISDVLWKTTSYLNNPDAVTTPTNPLSIKTKNMSIREGDNINGTHLPNSYLTGEVYEFALGKRIKFNEFILLANKIIDDRGYVTFYSENGIEIKLFITSLKYSWENEKLYNIKGERKI